MALKDLLVYVDQTENSLIRLRLAVDLAIRHDCHLAAIYAREWRRTRSDRHESSTEHEPVSVEGRRSPDGHIEASIDPVAERLRSTLAALTHDHGLRAELRSIDGVASIAVPQHARYADLCILGRDQSEAASVNYTFSEQLLFVTGRPVLFVPGPGSFATLGRHIAVAWNSSRPAARSLNDALPLIERAERTTVLMANPSGTIDRHGALPGELIVEHLRRHGAVVDAVRIENVLPDSIADRLQAEARAVGADLIVAGAFGHPRLWEKLLGGVTHELLARTSLPILMSH